MKITVKMGEIEISIDRPNFKDFGAAASNDSTIRKNMMNDTILPMLQDAVIKVKELYALTDKPL